MERAKISVRGIVQGVGMRPHVFNLAVSLGLKGYVQNSTSGVVIDVEGERLGEFIEKLAKNPPPLSEIKEVDIIPLPPAGYEGFLIKESLHSAGLTFVPPDVATCPDCLKEIEDPSDRRYSYPFTNCTNCGPRYTITFGMPYDRANTTMRQFNMCSSCKAEYDDPLSRRFHAQPNACPDCGPSLKLIIRGSEYKGNVLAKTAELLKDGYIMAIKGIGGFHLSCNAEDEDVVQRLRIRKRRSNKPFALMASDLEVVRKYCFLSSEEERLLKSPQRPIVLLKKRPDAPLALSIAPSNSRYGIMLPYAPLHHLIFKERGFSALVMTSGNLSEEPIAVGNDEALERLKELADAFLIHNRDIYMRADDSVAFVFEGRPRLLRRSRGYVPAPFELPFDAVEVLATGGELKNTFCLTKGNLAIVSQHIGDMTNQETLNFFEETLRNIKSIYEVEPVLIAHDLHPDYITTRWAEAQKMSKVGIQHHHAHIASCMAENCLEGKVIGIALDGTGYGTDGSVWGGEFLISGYDDFRREGHLSYVPLPGGDAAVREPWRMALSYIYEAYGVEARHIIEKLGFYERLRQGDIENTLIMIKNRINCPLTSSAGRLFDAVSSILGLCDRATFEAEAAIALEAVSEGAEDVLPYPFDIRTSSPFEIDFTITIISIINDVFSGVPASLAGARFHRTLAEASARAVERISASRGLRRVALSGGVFQNSLLLKFISEALKDRGLDVYSHERLPANDGGLSLGQAAIAAWRAMKN